MLHRILDIFHDLWSSSNRLAEGPRLVAKADAAASPKSSFEDRLGVRLGKDKDGRLVAGSLELVELGDVHQRGGHAWMSNLDAVRTMAEEEIAAALVEDDFFRRVGDLKFLICFATRDEAAAADRARALSESIRLRVTAAFPFLTGTFFVERVTSAFDGALLVNGDTLTDSLLLALNRVREDMRRTTLKRRTSLIRQSRVSFLPAIAPAKHRFALNSCVLDASTRPDGLATFRALAETTDIDETLAELDLCLLTRAVEALHDAQKRGPCAPLLVPVNFSTLSGSQCARDYCSLLTAVPERYRSLLTLELTGLPGGASVAVSPPEVLREIPIMRLVVQVPLEGTQPADAFVRTGLWGASISLIGRRSTEPSLSGQLSAFTNNASRSGMVAIAHGANSLGLARLAFEAHFNFIDGLAISLPCSAPKAPAAAPATILGSRRVSRRGNR